MKEFSADFVFAFRCIIMMMTRSMSSVFWEHRLLYCHTIMQCLMLDADVPQGGWGEAKCGEAEE